MLNSRVIFVFGLLLTLGSFALWLVFAGEGGAAHVHSTKEFFALGGTGAGIMVLVGSLLMK